MTRRTLLGLPLFIAIIAFTSACGDHGTNPTSNAGLFSGQVSEFSTQKPAAGTALIFRANGDQFMATTDANGMYAVTLPNVIPPPAYDVTADGVYIGFVRPIGRARGDLMVDHASCVARYGVISDIDTGTPLAGATVALRTKTMVTGADGWYRLDLGCPDLGALDFGTTFIDVTRANYADTTASAGRGVHNVVRNDIQMRRK
jgi:hypothetical protein